MGGTSPATCNRGDLRGREEELLTENEESALRSMKLGLFAMVDQVVEINIQIMSLVRYRSRKWSVIFNLPIGLDVWCGFKG